MHATDYGTAVLAACAIVALVAGIIAWFFKRGADEREFAVALRDNTQATERLSDKFERVTDILHEHDIRITRLEITPPPVHVTTKVEAPSHDLPSTHRDSGSP